MKNVLTGKPKVYLNGILLLSTDYSLDEEANKIKFNKNCNIDYFVTERPFFYGTSCFEYTPSFSYDFDGYIFLK